MTLEELDYTNDQQVFDYVVEKLREQGCQSISEGGNCLYRGPNGLKCAAGHLIPDDKYDERMENGLILGSNHCLSNSLVTSFFESTGVNLTLAASLQNVHDHHWNDFEQVLRARAKVFGLVYSPIA
jgi:hypothetical protein